MGRLQAEEMAQMMSLDDSLIWHLQANHYPPIPLTMLEPCKAAIEAGIEEDWEREIELPEGVFYKGLTTAPAWAMIEQHHLEAWLAYEEEEEE